MKVTREQVLRFRVHAQELDSTSSRRRDAAILDLGVQDTGPDGSRWALALRGAAIDEGDLVHAWTLRGAPHAYRRAEAAKVAAAVAPWDEADAAKRVFDASKNFRAAGIPVLDALDRVAAEMRDHVTEPRTKGELSTELTRRLPEPYVRWCRTCDATHLYEQTFRLSVLRAGLELEPGTSPPVVRRIPGWRGPAKRVPQHLDVIRGVLRLLGPSTPKLVAEFVDAPVKVVREHWPEDVETVSVDGQDLDLLAEDRDALSDPPSPDEVRLLGPFDLFLQGRDRALVLPDTEARKDLWRTLGRPGAVLRGAEVVGSWRPRSKGDRLRLAVTMWSGGRRPAGLAEQAERLAAHRGQAFDGWSD